MSKAAVKKARQIGKAMSSRPGAVALRKAVWQEMAPLRRALERLKP